eukprot:Clim_evm46s144 gene=Clim_evmTU46s144
MAAEEPEDFPKELKSILASFDDALKEAESKIKVIVENETQQTRQKLSPIEQCQLELSSAYAMNALYYVYLRTQGIDPAEHPLMAEIDRVKTYMEKLEEARKEAEEKGIEVPPPLVSAATTRRMMERVLKDTGMTEPKDDKEQTDRKDSSKKHAAPDGDGSKGSRKKRKKK